MFSIEKKVKELLVKKDMTIDMLGLKTNISVPTLHNIFNKNEANTKHLVKIAEVLDVPLTYFFEGDDTINKVNEGDVFYQKNSGKKNKNYQGDITINNDKHEIELLKKEVEALKREIELKDKIIGMLEKK